MVRNTLFRGVLFCGPDLSTQLTRCKSLVSLSQRSFGGIGMTGREFVESLWRRYHTELEGPVIAIRKALAELDPQTPEFVGLMQRQAKKEVPLLPYLHS